MEWITQTWTWLYIGTQDVWAVFIVVLYFSKYGNMKLGKDTDEPEFPLVKFCFTFYAKLTTPGTTRLFPIKNLAEFTWFVQVGQAC